MTTAEDVQRVRAEAEARADRNGLTLEVGDQADRVAWPSVRWLSVYLMRGREMIASMAMTYRDEASRMRALSICLERVYNRP